MKISNNSPTAFVELMNAYDWLIMPDLELGYFSIENAAQTWHRFNERNLYTFFDERGIYVFIGHDSMMFTFKIGQIHYAGIPNKHFTRHEAESAAFETAFERLEERLNKES